MTAVQISVPAALSRMITLQHLPAKWCWPRYPGSPGGYEESVRKWLRLYPGPETQKSLSNYHLWFSLVAPKANTTRLVVESGVLTGSHGHGLLQRKGALRGRIRAHRSEGDGSPDMPIPSQGGRWQQLAGEKGGEWEGQRMARLAFSQQAGSFPAASTGLPPSPPQTCLKPGSGWGSWVNAGRPGEPVRCRSSDSLSEPGIGKRATQWREAESVRTDLY